MAGTQRFRPSYLPNSLEQVEGWVCAPPHDRVPRTSVWIPRICGHFEYRRGPKFAQGPSKWI
jgi:hypothetical protein